jgi:hypothetical protein
VACLEKLEARRNYSKMEVNFIPSTGETLPGAKQGSLAWRPFIILCTFAYKFVSKLLQFLENALRISP